MSKHLNALTTKSLRIALATGLALSISWASKDAKADSGPDHRQRLDIFMQQAPENHTDNHGTAECTKTLATCSYLQIGDKTMEIFNPTIERSIDGSILVRAKAITKKSDPLHQEELVLYLTKSNPARIAVPTSHVTYASDSLCKTTASHNLIFSQIGQYLLGETSIDQTPCLTTP